MLRRQLAQAEAMQEISRALISTLDLHQVLTLILELARRVIDYDSASVLLVNSDKTGLVIAASYGFSTSLVGQAFLFDEGNISASVIAGQQTLVVDDVQQHPGWGRTRTDLEGATTIRAWIGAPLVVEGESLGLVTFDKHTPAFYSPQDARFASAFAAQAALAVRNARLFEETRRRAEEMATLQQVGLELAERAETLETVLPAVLERVRNLFHADGCEIWLWHKDSGTLELVTYLAGTGPDMRGLRIRPGEGFNGRLFESGQPLLLDDYAAWPGRLAPWEGVPHHAIMGVLLVWHGRRIGTLCVHHSDPSLRFKPDDVRLLGLLANHAAAAIANARLLDETRRQLAELEVLNEIGRALSSIIQLDALIELIYRQVSRLMDTTNFYVALYDEARRWIEFAIEIEAGQRCPPRGRAVADGLTEYILTTRQVLFVPSEFDRDKIYGAASIRPRGRPARSWLGVPLIAGDRPLGVMAVQSYERNYAYDERDKRVLVTIAAQAAVAVQNARLYEAEQVRIQELEARQRQLAEILHLGNRLRADLAPVTIAEYIAEAALAATGFGVALVSLVEGDPPALRRVASAGIAPETWARLQPTAQPLSVLLEFLRDEFRISQSYFIPHERRPPELGERLQLYVSAADDSSWQPGRWHPRDILVVPLRDKDGQIVGALSVDEPADGLRPSLATIGALEIFANQAAAALQNARLYEAEQQRVRELEAKQRQLATILRAGNLLRADLSLESILTHLAHAAREATGFNVAVLSLLEGEPPVLRRVAAAGIPPAVFAEFQQHTVDFDTIKKLMNDRFRVSQSYFLPHERSEEWLENIEGLVTLPDSTDWQPGQWHPYDALFTPLRDRSGRVIGTLSVDGPVDNRRPTLATIEMLEIFANQASVAVQNARLYQAAHEQADRLALINRVARQTTQTLALNKVLDTAVQSIRATFGYQDVGILLLEDNGLVLRAAAGHIFETLCGQFRIAVGQGLTGWAAANRQTVIVGDTQLDRRYFAVDANTRSEIVVPLIASGQLVGVLNVESNKPYAFKDDDVLGLETMADQLAGAIINAQLYTEAQQRAEELRQQKAELELLYRSANALAATLDSTALLNQLLPLAVSVANVSYGSVFLLDEAGQVTHQALTRRGLAEVEIERVTRLVLEHGLAGWVYRHAQPALLTDVQHDERWIRLDAPYEPVGSAVCVPLTVRQSVRGIITLLHSAIGHFTERHQRTLMAIAQQAATALENIYLYERERRRAEQLALLHRVAAAVTSSLDIAQVLQAATTRLVQLFEVDHCGIVLFDEHLNYGQLMAEHPPTDAAGSRFPLADDQIEQELVATRRPVSSVNVEAGERLGVSSRAALRDSSVVSTLFVPLIIKDRLIGSFGLDVCSAPRTFSAEDIELAQTIAAQIAIAVDNARLYAESVTRVEQEMAIARQIQQNLFPRQLPAVPGLRIAAVCRPARETGGDFYEFVVVDDRRLSIIVGDVSGKGLPAAMLMAAARSTARARAYEHSSPARVLNEVNELLQADVPAGSFVAMSCSMIDVDMGRLMISNGGQVSPLVLPADGPAAFIRLPSPKLPLGVWPDLEYREAQCTLRPGDTVLFCTDGIVEAHNPAGEMFGFERLGQVVNRCAGLSVDELLTAVLESVDTFAEGIEQYDDITLVVVRRVAS